MNNKEHKEENGRLREELEKYQSLLAKSTTDRVVTSIKDNKKSKEDLEMLNEGWKIECEKKDMIINEMVIYIMTHSSVPTLRHRFCPNYEREECKYNCDDTKVKSKCIIEYFTKKAEESEK